MEETSKLKLAEEVKEILGKYNLEVLVPDEYKTVYKYVDEHPEKEIEDFKHPTITDSSLNKKFSKNIPKGWYGCSIGNPTPINWYVAIEKILDFLVKKDPDFEIHQIKIKFGGIRFYCESEKIEDIFDICRVVESALYSRKLMY